jgi:hypothetical protein
MDTKFFRTIELIEPGDLVLYHGSIPSHHGLWLAIPCPCRVCRRLDEIGFPDVRYALVDPWRELSGPHHVRPESITRSVACS